MSMRAFLVLTVIVWTSAAWSAHGYLRDAPNRLSFWVFFALTMAGNLGAVLAPDVISFYVSYAVMTFAAYGLVVHERTPAAFRAGRVYVTMALAGELLLLAAFVLLVGTAINLPMGQVPAAVAAAPRRDLLVTLLLLGFGIKAGAVPLHVWLPLAHPVAPTPASAVLSGAMIKAGLFGWLSFLPLGHGTLGTHGSVCVVAGFVAVFFGAVVGATQRDAKTTLAYSSISQMGLATVAIGVGLSSPASADAVFSAVALFALHHALAKGALFLGVAVPVGASVGRRRIRALGMFLAALAIGGAPFTSGAAAKLALHGVVVRSSAAPTLDWLLSLGAIGSTVLMVRVLALALARNGEAAQRSSAMAPWLVLVLFPWLLIVAPGARPLFSWAHVWSSTWPAAIGVGVGLRLCQRPPARVPAGDVLEVVSVAARGLKPTLARLLLASQAAVTRFRTRRARFLARWTARIGRIDRAEAALSSFGAVGALALFLIVVLLLVVVPR